MPTLFPNTRKNQTGGVSLWMSRLATTFTRPCIIKVDNFLCPKSLKMVFSYWKQVSCFLWRMWIGRNRYRETESTTSILEFFCRSKEVTSERFSQKNIQVGTAMLKRRSLIECFGDAFIAHRPNVLARMDKRMTRPEESDVDLLAYLCMSRVRMLV